MSACCTEKAALLMAYVLLLMTSGLLRQIHGNPAIEVIVDRSWPSTAFQRIRNPCAGGQPVTSQRLMTRSIGLMLQRFTFRQVAIMIDGFQRDVAELKRTYAGRRHAMFVGMHVDGMPLSSQVNMQLDVNGAVIETIEQLSRVAILLDLVAAEEDQYEPNPLAPSMIGLYDHPERGIYNILCTLRIVLATSNSADARGPDISRLIGRASQLTLIETRQPSHRHLRTYSILHDLEELLARLKVRFNNLSV